MALDALKKLHQALVDTKQGYEEAIKDASDPVAGGIFKSMLALRERDHAELHPYLDRTNQEGIDNGSLMASIHETVISARAAITGLGTNAMGSFVMGEDQILAKYDTAIDEAKGNAELVNVLSRQRSHLAAKISKMKTVAE